MNGLAPLRSAPLTADQVLARLNANATIALTSPVTVATGTITASNPAETLTQTWNNAAAVFTAWKLNVTNTASAAGSLLLDLQVGGSSKWNADKGGNVTNTGTLAVAGKVSFTDTTAAAATLGTGALAIGNSTDYVNIGGGKIYAQVSGGGGLTFKTTDTANGVIVTLDRASNARQTTIQHSLAGTLEWVHGTGFSNAGSASTDFCIGPSASLAAAYFRIATGGALTLTQTGATHTISGTTDATAVGTASVVLAGGLSVAKQIRNAAAILSNSATGGIGYATGAGGTVTQATSKSTGVTLNTVCGTITMNAAALASATSVSFTWTNSAIAATDYIDIQHDSVGTLGGYAICVTPAAGSATVTVRNTTAGSLSEAIVLRFFVTKAVTS